MNIVAPETSDGRKALDTKGLGGRLAKDAVNAGKDAMKDALETGELPDAPDVSNVDFADLLYKIFCCCCKMGKEALEDKLNEELENGADLAKGLQKDAQRGLKKGLQKELQNMTSEND